MGLCGRTKRELGTVSNAWYSLSGITSYYRPKRASSHVVPPLELEKVGCACRGARQAPLRTREVKLSRVFLVIGRAFNKYPKTPQRRLNKLLSKSRLMEYEQYLFPSLVRRGSEKKKSATKINWRRVKTGSE